MLASAMDLPVIALCGTWISNAAMRDLAQWQRIYAILRRRRRQEGIEQLVEAFNSRLVRCDTLRRQGPRELAVRTDGKALLQASIPAAITRHQREYATRSVSDHHDMASLATAS